MWVLSRSFASLWMTMVKRRMTILISTENVAGIYFLFYIVQAAVIAIGNDGLRLLLENIEIIHYPTTEEGGAIGQGRFVHNDLGSLGLDAFHHALDGALTEIVAIGFHGQSIDSDYR